MPDIVILALPADRTRADCILDGLSAPSAKALFVPRLVVAHPDDANWREAVRDAEAARCVVLCWSRTAANVAPLVALGQRLCNGGTAISVELDPDSLPATLAGCSNYELHGFRCRRDPFCRFVFGDSYVSQIVAAAQEKAMGRDPPSPVTLARMVRARAWVAGVGAAAAFGLFSNVLQFGQLPFVAQWLDRDAAAAFAKAKAAPQPCAALRRFSRTHTGSAFANEAIELLATCHSVTKIVPTPQRTSLPIYGRTDAAARADAQRLCAAQARTMHGRLNDVAIRSRNAEGAGEAECRLTVPVQQSHEVMAGRESIPTP
jgi:hypothetical protein